jgi:restriction system protein
MAKKSLNLKFLMYMEPTIAALRHLGNSARPKEVVAQVEAMCKVPSDDLTRRTKSGQTIFENQVHWCRAYLAKSGYIDSTQRGVWRLTEQGKTETLTKQRVDEIFRTVQGRGFESVAEDAEEMPIAITAIEPELSPEIVEYKSQAISRLKLLSPAGFEQFCQDVLYESGFESVEVTGRTGDKGIDGVGMLKINPLFSLKVVFQAKKYENSVGSGMVRDFRGASIGRADRGLLITTGTFTRDARQEASRDGAMHIELIDGEDLVNLMEELEFGLKPVKTYVLDDQFFSRYEGKTTAP